MKRNAKTYLSLFLSLLRIGAFTFGGGYAMVALLEREFVEKKKWMTNDEFLDLVAVAESTPGPLAVNSATYIGYRVGGVGGSALATLGVVLPSFCVIYLISLFFDKFLSLTFVSYAFRGIQVCVTYLILSAGVKMIRHLKKDVLSAVILCATVLAMILLTLFAVRFSSIFYILISGCAGLFVYLLRSAKERRKDP